MTNGRQSLLNTIGNIALESKTEFAFLIAIEKSGAVRFADVISSGYDIRNARIIYVTEVVQNYDKLANALDDLGMQWGLVEWLTIQLRQEEKHMGGTVESQRLRTEYWKLRTQKAEAELLKVTNELIDLEERFDDVLSRREYGV